MRRSLIRIRPRNRNETDDRDLARFPYVAPVWLIGLAGFIAVVIATLNVKLLLNFVFV